MYIFLGILSVFFWGILDNALLALSFFIFLVSIKFFINKHEELEKCKKELPQIKKEIITRGILLIFLIFLFLFLGLQESHIEKNSEKIVSNEKVNEEFPIDEWDNAISNNDFDLAEKIIKKEKDPILKLIQYNVLIKTQFSIFANYLEKKDYKNAKIQGDKLIEKAVEAIQIIDEQDMNNDLIKQDVYELIDVIFHTSYFINIFLHKEDNVDISQYSYYAELGVNAVSALPKSRITADIEKQKDFLLFELEFFKKQSSKCMSNGCLYNGQCVIKPDNAYCVAEDLNNAWKCESGYIDNGTSCLSPSGKKQNTCNAYVKGNVSFNTGAKIYHIPGCENYYDVKINSAYGERYFCSEQAARNAGWRKAWNCP